MPNNQVIALRVHNASVDVIIEGVLHDNRTLNLPPGCVGICFVFESEEAAKKHCGDDVEVVGITYNQD